MLSNPRSMLANVSTEVSVLHQRKQTGKQPTKQTHNRCHLRSSGSDYRDTTLTNGAEIQALADDVFGRPPNSGLDRDCPWQSASRQRLREGSEIRRALRPRHSVVGGLLGGGGVLIRHEENLQVRHLVFHHSGDSAICDFAEQHARLC